MIKHYLVSVENNARELEANLWLTAKLNLMSGIVIGATAVMVMKKMYERKQCKKHSDAHAPAAASD